MLTQAQAKAVKDAHEILRAIPHQAFGALVQDMAMEMHPDAITRLSNQLATIAHHKARGDLDAMMRRVEGQV